MDSTTKDELNIKTSLLSEDRPISRLKTKEEIESEMIKIPQSMLRTPKEVWKDMKENKLEEELVNAIDSIKESCVDAIHDLDAENLASCAFEIGKIYALCSSLSDKIGGDDE